MHVGISFSVIKSSRCVLWPCKYIPECSSCYAPRGPAEGALPLSSIHWQLLSAVEGCCWDLAAGWPWTQTGHTELWCWAAPSEGGSPWSDSYTDSSSVRIPTGERSPYSPPSSLEHPQSFLTPETNPERFYAFKCSWLLLLNVKGKPFATWGFGPDGSALLTLPKPW